jgi:sugar phosphate isomerase/epimerase
MSWSHIKLPKAKGLFPFKIGTTSYIVPDGVVPNARLLADVVDDVELLFYESGEGSLPTAAEVAELGVIAAASGTTYTVHLPVDFKLGSPDPVEADMAVEGHLRAIERSASVARRYVIHPNGRRPGTDPDFPKRVEDAFARVAPAVPPHAPLCVENLMFPFSEVEPVLSKGPYSVCVDTGHLQVSGHPAAEHWRRHKASTPIVHLHGASGGVDHLSLAKGDQGDVDLWLGLLEDFKGVVCLELFDSLALAESIHRLAGLHDNFRPVRVQYKSEKLSSIKLNPSLRETW